MPVKVQIPVSQITPQNRKLLFQQKEKTLRYRQMIVVKPQRKLGAVWTSDKVSQRKPVIMCEDCWRKYKGWWIRENYKPDWGWRYIGDCDGCSTIGIFSTLFHPEEMFYKVLGPNHGRQSKPY